MNISSPPNKLRIFLQVLLSWVEILYKLDRWWVCLTMYGFIRDSLKCTLGCPKKKPSLASWCLLSVLSAQKIASLKMGAKKKTFTTNLRIPKFFLNLHTPSTQSCSLMLSIGENPRLPPKQHYLATDFISTRVLSKAPRVGHLG